MKTIGDLKLQVAGAGFAIALLASGCAMFEPRAERYVPPPVGSTWVTARSDTGSYGSANVQIASTYRGERSWQGRRVNAYESTELTLLATPEGAFVAQVKGDAPVFTWDPPISFQWPLEVGKSWSRSFRMTVHASKQTIPVQDTQTVEAYEDVVTRAGTFKAFKVRTVDNFGNDNVSWYSPDLGIFIKQSLKRTAKHAQGVGARELEIVSQTIRR